jgi:hypothetical protein
LYEPLADVAGTGTYCEEEYQRGGGSRGRPPHAFRIASYVTKSLTLTWQLRVSPRWHAGKRADAGAANTVRWNSPNSLSAAIVIETGGGRRPVIRAEREGDVNQIAARIPGKHLASPAGKVSLGHVAAIAYRMFVMREISTPEKAAYETSFLGHRCAQLGLSEGALKVAIHRLRRRFRDITRAEIAQTLHDTADLDDEMRHLVNALAT